jgi:hypothetical protein
MKVYFITRFSIFDPAFKGFRLSRNHSQRQYEKRLFSAARLDHKFREFQAITLPSVLSQNRPNWEWLIYTSDRLPADYRRRLEVLVGPYSNIGVITTSSFSDFFTKDQTYGYESPFATVRLDDDDGLNSRFIERLERYAANAGSIVSFTDGRLVKLDKDRVIVGEKTSERNNAQGLAGIELRIYGCGRHSDIQTRYNVIYDSTPDMYLLGCSTFTDTGRGFTSLERIAGKGRRLLWLMVTRPGELRHELSGPLRKLLRRKRHA